MGILAFNLLRMLRQFYLMGEEVKWSIECLIKRLIKVGAKVASDHPKAYSVSRELALDRIPGQTPQDWEDLGIIPAITGKTTFSEGP
jgi:hypothetical protein